MKNLAERLILHYSTIALIAALLSGCRRTESSPSTPLPDVPARNLLLEAASFPEGWLAHRCEYDCDRKEGDFYATRFFDREVKPGIGYQEVFRLSSVEEAHSKFAQMLQDAFRKSSNIPSTEFAPPPQIDYQSPIANEAHLACGVDVDPRCRAILRYRNYLVYLTLPLDSWESYSLTSKDDGLQINDMEPILQALDRQVAESFNIPFSQLEVSPSVTRLPGMPGPTPSISLSSLITALESDDLEVRINAANSISEEGASGALAVSALIQNLQHRDPRVRSAAAEALGRIGQDATAAVSMLVSLLHHDLSYDVRWRAAETLGLIGDRSAVPALIEALDDPESLVGRHAADAIGQLTRQQFPWIGNNHSEFDEQGRLWKTRFAREWWEREGKYQDWSK